MRWTNSTYRLAMRGFSLVEIMVAMVIGLIAVIVIFQVFAVFERQKRTSTGAGDAQQNGLLALFAVERDARMSGYGINYAPWLGCNVSAYDAGPPIRDPLNFVLSPAQITDGLNNAPDTITIVYANSSQLATSVPLLSASPAGSISFSVANGFGFAVGDSVIVGEAGVGCSLATVTSIPTPNSQTLNHDSGTYTNSSGASQNARYNRNGGMAQGYGAWSLLTNTGGRILDIGPSPTVVTYSILNSQLIASFLLQGGAAVPIAGGIVQLQAQYGKDKNNDGIVNELTEWETTPPASATEWALVRALRLVVVARSAQAERPKDPVTGQIITGACNTTTVAPPASIPIDLTADPDWQCYRYRVFETVVPLRNQIWAPT